MRCCHIFEDRRLDQKSWIDDIECEFEYRYRRLGCVYRGPGGSVCVELDIRVKERILVLVFLRPRVMAKLIRVPRN
jgi:hypothetical protein